MAAAAPAGGGGAAAAPALVRLPAVPASTTLSLHPAAFASAADPTLWTLPRDSPVVWSLRFIEFDMPPAPAPAEVNAFELGATLLAALSYDSLPAVDENALSVANLVEWWFLRAEASAVLSELRQARLFTKQYDSVYELREAITSSTLVTKSIVRFRAALLERADPFDTPAGGGAGTRAAAAAAAVPPAPGPVELEFLRRLSFFVFIREGRRVSPDCPGVLLSMMVALLGSSNRDATRRDDSSAIRLAATTLKSYVIEAERLPASAGDAMLASSIPRYFCRLFHVMPVTLRSVARSVSAMDADLRDSHVLLLGRGSEVESIYWSRIHDHMSQFEVLSHFDGHTLGVGDTRMCMERLTAQYSKVSSAPGLTPLARLAELDRVLKEAEKGEHISDLFNAGSTATEVVDDLLGVTAALSAPLPPGASDPAPASAGGAGGAMPGGSALSAAALERAMNKRFMDTVDDADGLEGLELLDVCAATTSVLILRYFYFASAFLITRHEIFGRMSKAMPERRSHLAQGVITGAASVGSTDQYATYDLTPEQDTKFFGLDWDNQFDMVNHSIDRPERGGFLAVRYLETACTFGHVSFDQHYVTESTLLGVRTWFDFVLLAAGYSSAPAAGYTWFQVIDKQLDLVRYIDGLPDSERDPWKKWARDNFLVHALRRACTHAGGILRSHEPASETFGAFLPADAVFFANIDRRFKDAAPVALVRRAFPGLMQSAPVQLAGTSAASSSQGVGGGLGGGGGGKTKGQKRHDGLGGGKLSYMLASGKLFLAGRTYDVQASADKLGIPVDSKDWAVMYTTKTGNDKLAVCLDPAHHKGLGDSHHTPPKGFNRATFAKEFSQNATDAEKTEAGWTSVSAGGGKKPRK